jgi:hypothetical protein
MESTLVQQGPGVEPGDCLFILYLYSDAGYADLPITLLGAPVSLGENLRRPYGLGLDSTALAPLPAQDLMCAFGIIGVATRYIRV